LVLPAKNIEASLYVWKTGPIAKLSKLLAKRFLSDSWTYQPADGAQRPMPDTIVRAHDFLRGAVEAFPFWKSEMKPRLETIFQRYVGSHTMIDLKPDIQALEDWLAQQLEVSLATDAECAPTPLRNMGDGWQSIIRLAALEAVCEYPELSKERIVLLVEEPETHLHPHLRRKMRKVLAALAAKGWTVVYTTHSPELVSFDERQRLARLVRSRGQVQMRSVDTDQLDGNAKLQSKLDDRGAHDFLFSTGSVFCEGKDDAFALRVALDKSAVDYDARSVSVSQCGSVTAMPAFTSIATALGIRWCAVTDEDTQADGTTKPQTKKA
jgi:predicted ATP-dependent endonuclease of OLD family